MAAPRAEAMFLRAHSLPVRVRAMALGSPLSAE
jgi:hypothetical protein